MMDDPPTRDPFDVADLLTSLRVKQQPQLLSDTEHLYELLQTALIIEDHDSRLSRLESARAVAHNLAGILGSLDLSDSAERARAIERVIGEDFSTNILSLVDHLGDSIRAENS